MPGVISCEEGIVWVESSILIIFALRRHYNKFMVDPTSTICLNIKTEMNISKKETFLITT